MKNLNLKEIALFCGKAVVTVALTLTSCSEEVLNPETPQLAPVNVSVKDFSVTQEDFPGTTRGTAVSDKESVKFLTLAFYASDGTEVFKHTQDRNDATTYTTFGEFSTSLMYGSYTMVVIANEGKNAITLTSPTVATYGDNNTKDTWVYTQAVNITGNNAVNLSATLDRICALLAVVSTDNRPAGVTHMRLTLSAGGKSFSPTIGLATSNTGFTTTLAFPASTLGTTTAMATYLFLATDEQNINVTIETLDAADGNVLFSKTITDVPMKRNRQTKLTGAMYSGTSVSGTSFQVNTAWLPDTQMSF